MKFFKKVKKIHFVGIGGAGMIGIARILLKKGSLTRFSRIFDPNIRQMRRLCLQNETRRTVIPKQPRELAREEHPFFWFVKRHEDSSNILDQFNRFSMIVARYDCTFNQGCIGKVFCKFFNVWTKHRVDWIGMIREFIRS